MSQLLRRVGRVTKNTLAFVGFGVSTGSAYQYNEFRKTNLATSNEGGKKKVLVLPFHRMKIVECKKANVQDLLKKLTEGKDDDRPLEVELKQLVDVIHAAASDPSIVALYGTFGQGSGFQCGGYAHIEELRNAIKVFNESHRVHSHPDRDHLLNDATQEQRNNAVKKKYSFAFADSFESPADPGNKEYFLASAFSNIHLQRRGNVNLFGVSSYSIFLKGALDKYGIKANVFKHGKYKNAPNIFTERGYTREHLENTKAIVDSLNLTVCSSIVQSRRLYDSFSQSTWKSLHNYGTMTAENAREIGLIDYLSSINPISDLIASNKKSENKNSDKEKYHLSALEEKFQATEAVSYKDYVAFLAKKKEAQKKKWRIHKAMEDATRKSSATEFLLTALGYDAPHFNLDKREYNEEKGKQTNEKIALVHINGSINDKMAQRITSMFQKIKTQKDVKCVVLRIDSPGGSVTASETILEECKDMPQPVVCSFSNVAASGGYYVASQSKRIFASPTTVTGSIGVFGITIDATGLGKRHGIDMQHVSSGQHAMTYNIFHPVTKAVKKNLWRSMDRTYNYFKELVAVGREMSLDDVESVAQGRVHSGEQAKENGLVDELGGMNRAIAYAMRTHTSSGFANVEVWPKPTSLKDHILSMIGLDDDSNRSDKDHDDPPGKEVSLHQLDGILNGQLRAASTLDVLMRARNSPGVMLTMDEGTAFDLTFQDNTKSWHQSDSFWR